MKKYFKELQNCDFPLNLLNVIKFQTFDKQYTLFKNRKGEG